MKKSLVVSGQARLGRVPGQVPSSARLQEKLLAKQLQRKPKPVTEARLLNHDGAYLTIDSVVGNLGLSQEEEASWRVFLREAVLADSDVAVRKSAMAKMYQDKMDPTLRRPLLQRIMGYRRDTLRKSRVLVYTVDELRKSMNTARLEAPRLVLKGRK